MNRFFLLLVTALLAIAALGCSAVPGSSPSASEEARLAAGREGLIRQYYIALNKGRHEAAWKLLSSKTFKVTFPDKSAYTFKARPPLPDFKKGAANIRKIKLVTVKELTGKTDLARFLYGYEVTVDITYYEEIVNRSGANTFLLFVSSPPNSAPRLHNTSSNF